MISRYSREKMVKVWGDENRFKKWLDIEIAVCEAQKALGIITEKILAKIKEKASFTVEEIRKREAENQHEMVAFIDVIGKNVGKEARFIHLGLTSSDIMDTAMSLQMLDSIAIIEEDLQKMMASIKRLALKYKFTPMIGRTHGVHAEPTTFGLKLAVWYAELKRHETRLKNLKAIVGVGKISGAVGNYAQIDPEVEKIALKKLGLAVPPVCTQIIQRDRHAEYIMVFALIAATCEKIATEIRNLQRTEIGELEEPFAQKQKGSSAMPHKKNPVKCEQICGLARVVRSAVIPALENITLWHERDISHSSVERVILPDVSITLDYMLSVMTTILDGLTVDVKKMRENIDLTKGMVFSQRLMLRLVAAGMPRDKAHTMVQGKVMSSIKKGVNFMDEVIKDGEIRRYLTLEEIEALFDLDIYIKNVDYIFKRALD